MKKAVVNPSVRIYARTCCGNQQRSNNQWERVANLGGRPNRYTRAVTTYGAAVPELVVSIGATTDFAAAVECGRYTPSGKRAVKAHVECAGTGTTIFVSRAVAGEPLELFDVEAYNLHQPMVGIGHPLEYK
eukprot:SAG31_NODE_17374_length_673_cov_1.050523_1_plen_130_part_10